MRTRTGTGTMPTILVIVVTSGGGRLWVARRCAALDEVWRAASVARTGVGPITFADAAMFRAEDAAGVR
jgi:hypothetical protein